MGITSLKGKIAKNIWRTKESKGLPKDLWSRSRLLLEIMNASARLENLKLQGSPPDVRLHKLSENWKGHWSITIQKTSGWRIVFKFAGGEFNDVEIIDYHGG